MVIKGQMSLVLGRMGYGESDGQDGGVIVRDKETGEFRCEFAKVSGMVANASTTESLGKKYGAFGGWGIASR